MNNIIGVTGWRYAHEFMHSYSKYHPVQINNRIILCDCSRSFQLENRLGIKPNKFKYKSKDKLYIFNKNKILRRTYVL